MTKFPSKAELMKMPLARVRNIDIRTKEEEKIVQSVVNARRQEVPVATAVSRRDVPDIKTKEDEDKWQKIMDERHAALIPEAVDIEDESEEEEDDGDGEDIDLDTTDTDAAKAKAEGKTPVKALEKAQFCDSCDAKAKTHKKYCPKHKDNLKK